MGLAIKLCQPEGPLLLLSRFAACGKPGLLPGVLVEQLRKPRISVTTSPHRRHARMGIARQTAGQQSAEPNPPLSVFARREGGGEELGVGPLCDWFGAGDVRESAGRNLMHYRW